MTYSSARLFFFCRKTAFWVMARGSPPSRLQMWWFFRSYIHLYCFGWRISLELACCMVSGFFSRSFSISGCKFFPAFFSSNSSANIGVRLSRLKTFSANPSRLFILWREVVRILREMFLLSKFAKNCLSSFSSFLRHPSILSMTNSTYLSFRKSWI